MFYVYHGYVNSDHYDSADGPVHELTVCETEEDVLSLKEDFDLNAHEESTHIIFIVIEGKVRELEPKEKVIAWKLT
jgi:hypothetical protein